MVTIATATSGSRRRPPLDECFATRAIVPARTCFHGLTRLSAQPSAVSVCAELGHAPSPVLARFVLALVSKRKSGTNLACSRNGTQALLWPPKREASACDRDPGEIGPGPDAASDRTVERVGRG